MTDHTADFSLQNTLANAASAVTSAAITSALDEVTNQGGAVAGGLSDREDTYDALTLAGITEDEAREDALAEDGGG